MILTYRPAQLHREGRYAGDESLGSAPTTEPKGLTTMSTMTEDFQTHVRDTADGYVSTLGLLWDHVDRDEEFEGEHPRDYLESMPLEIVWEKGEPFAIVLGTGGPHVEITGGGRQGGYTLAVYWGSTPVHRSGEAITRTGEYFREMVEEGE